VRVRLVVAPAMIAFRRFVEAIAGAFGLPTAVPEEVWPLIGRLVQPPPSRKMWLAIATYLEAEGESRDGKLAVARSIVNRARARNLSISDTIFAAEQYSSLNTYSRRRLLLDSLRDDVWSECWSVADEAMDPQGRDPSHGATHFLNPEATRQERGDGLLPKWAADPHDRTRVNAALVTAEIDNHVFLKTA
jgi:spore germination cell wall hydrolase CwlJ-like protein